MLVGGAGGAWFGGTLPAPSRAAAEGVLGCCGGVAGAGALPASSSGSTPTGSYRSWPPAGAAIASMWQHAVHVMCSRAAPRHACYLHSPFTHLRSAPPPCLRHHPSAPTPTLPACLPACRCRHQADQGRQRAAAGDADHKPHGGHDCTHRGGTGRGHRVSGCGRAGGRRACGGRACGGRACGGWACGGRACGRRACRGQAQPVLSGWGGGVAGGAQERETSPGECAVAWCCGAGCGGVWRAGGRAAHRQKSTPHSHCGRAGWHGLHPARLLHPCARSCTAQPPCRLTSHPACSPCLLTLPDHPACLLTTLAQLPLAATAPPPWLC